MNRFVVLIYWFVASFSFGETPVLVLHRHSTFGDVKEMGKKVAKEGGFGIDVKIRGGIQTLSILFPVINPREIEGQWMRFLTVSAGLEDESKRVSKDGKFRYYEIVIEKGVFTMEGKPIVNFESIFQGGKELPCIGVKISANENMVEVHEGLCEIRRFCGGRMFFYDNE